jgi:hypothetical protein
MIFITKFSVHSHTSVEYELKEWPAKFVPELSRLSIRHFELVALTFMPIILSLCVTVWACNSIVLKNWINMCLLSVL